MLRIIVKFLGKIMVPNLLMIHTEIFADKIWCPDLFQNLGLRKVGACTDKTQSWNYWSWVMGT